MSKHKCSGPNDAAFPTVEFVGDKGVGGQPGLSAREWFAGMALQGLLAGRGSWTAGNHVAAGDFAMWAFVYADAMLAESKKGN